MPVKLILYTQEVLFQMFLWEVLSCPVSSLGHSLSFQQQ